MERDTLRHFEILNLRNCPWCKIPHLLAEISLSNYPRHQGSVCHHPLAAGTNIFMVIYHAGHNVLCLLTDDHLPLERNRKQHSVLGFESRFLFFLC